MCVCGEPEARRPGRVGDSTCSEMSHDCGVQRVAQTPAERVARLCQLAGQVAEGYLPLAVALHEEHLAGLWEKARIPAGVQDESEEQFWEEALGLKRRTACQLIAIGRVLTKIGRQDEAREALVPGASLRGEMAFG